MRISYIKSFLTYKLPFGVPDELVMIHLNLSDENVTACHFCSFLLNFMHCILHFYQNLPKQIIYNKTNRVIKMLIN